MTNKRNDILVSDLATLKGAQAGETIDVVGSTVAGDGGGGTYRWDGTTWVKFAMNMLFEGAGGYAPTTMATQQWVPVAGAWGYQNTGAANTSQGTLATDAPSGIKPAGLRITNTATTASTNLYNYPSTTFRMNTLVSFVKRWGLHPSSATPTNARFFVGIIATTWLGSASEPSAALLNCIGMAADSTDTNMQLIHNDGSGTCTKIDLGSSFPVRTTAAVYELKLVPRSGGAVVDYYIKRFDSAASTSGTISTNLPVTGTDMRWLVSGTNYTTTTSFGLVMYGATIQTNFWNP